MTDFSQAKLEAIYIHYVGNKNLEEKLTLATEDITIAEGLTSGYLLKYLLNHFTNNEVYNFTHTSNIELNEIFSFAKRIFDKPDELYQASIDAAKHLFEKSVHPKISGGDLCVCYFKNCNIDNVVTDAVGFFKSENKEVFLKFDSDENNTIVKHDDGININKLDKGCIIFNTASEQGYKVCVIDGNRSNDTQYWKNEFLNIKPAADNYHFTKDCLTIAKEFVTKQLIEDFEVSKADQIDLLNRSVGYFKNNETFDQENFEKEVFQDTNIINSFKQFDEDYRIENELAASGNFEISTQAVKKQAKIFKSILKLDKNFHVYIHGDRQQIEQGVDEDGRKYYKLYYKDES